MNGIRRNTLALAALAVFATTGCADTSPESEVGEMAEEMEPTADQTTAGEMADAPASGLLNPETASEDELLGIPHMDAEIVDRLIAGRPFEDMRELDGILAESLDEMQREEVYTEMFKPLDLNNATEEEILLIPGVGDRMAHEFEEYRPYPGIQLFREEIGKYVDEEEVARLEQYVRIP